MKAGKVTASKAEPFLTRNSKIFSFANTVQQHPNPEHSIATQSTGAGLLDILKMLLYIYT